MVEVPVEVQAGESLEGRSPAGRDGVGEWIGSGGFGRIVWVRRG